MKVRVVTHASDPAATHELPHGGYYKYVEADCLNCKWLEESDLAHKWHECGCPITPVPKSVQVIHAMVSVQAPFRDCPAWEAQPLAVPLVSYVEADPFEPMCEECGLPLHGHWRGRDCRV